MIIAIAGASGLTGSHCLQLLLKQTEVIEVIAIGRKPLPIQHPKLTQVLLQNGVLTTEVVADAFISCIGTTIKKAGSKSAFELTDRHLPVQIAMKLNKQGCSTGAVISSMGASSNSTIFYSRIKAAMEADFAEIGFKSLYILRPSIIDGHRTENRLMEKVALHIMRALRPIMIGGLRNIRAIKASDIAQVLVQSVIHPTPGTHLYLSHTIFTLAKSK